MVIPVDRAAADPFDLRRFQTAQEGIYDDVLEELQAGRKRSHWMWFVFPQLDGLGGSGMARRYAIKGLAEAGAYLRHPQLGARLLECTRTVIGIDGRTAHQIFGSPDDMKFRSSMTLFERVRGADAAFSVALDRYYAGHRDAATIRMLEAAP